MPTLILSEQDVRDLLPMRECIDVMADALTSVAEGTAVMPLRTVLRMAGTQNGFVAMPAIVGAGSAASIGAKVITVFPGNDATPFDSHIGVVLLFDAEFGSLLAIADASSITAIRTAAVSGLATRFLARDDASVLAVLGAGVLALPHVEAMCAVRPIRALRLWSRSGTAPESRAGRVAAKARELFGLDVELCETVDGAVQGADVVCTITASQKPVLEGRSIAKGTHVNAVGAYMRDTRELDSAAVAMSRVFADRRESLLAEAGDFLIPLAEGVITEGHLLGELGELVTGRIVGRQHEDDVTLFKSLGLAVEDVAAVRHLHTRARAAGRGVELELGGRR